MSPLIADNFIKDPSIKQAKQQLLECLSKYREQITEICPPQAELKQSYEETLKIFSDFRSTPLFYPYLGSGIGNGALVELADGSVKYDFISGIGTHFGHSHPKIIEASLDAALQDISMQGHLQQNRDTFLLSELLIKNSGLDHCFLTTSGAMANENALKLVFHKQAPAQRILAFERCFVGRTLTLAQITDKPAFRKGLPHTLHIDYVPFYDWRDPMGSTERALALLEKYLHRHPKGYACMLFELIQGEAGSYPGKTEFFLALIKKLKEHNIAIIVDEVQSFGRTDHLFAFQHFGLQEHVDIVTVGKLLHTCATLFNKEFHPQPGLLAQTYTAATSSIHVATTILTTLLEEGYLGLNGKNMQIRKQFVDHLQAISDRNPNSFEGPFGHGLMIAITPFKGKREKVIAYAKALFEAGVIVFIAGDRPTRIRFLVPAGGVTPKDIENVAQILESTLRKM